MTLTGVIFDLDDTLLDSRALRSVRDGRDWQAVMSRLHEVKEFDVGHDPTRVTDLPQAARDRELSVGLLTHSPRGYAEALLKAHGMRVDAMVTGSDGYATKPDPGGLLAVISELGLMPASTVYVGDAAADFGAAAAAGARSIGVAWERRSPAEWVHSWPDVAISRPRRLLEFMDGADDLALWAEVTNDRRLFWGSVMQPNAHTLGLGRYFATRDWRCPGHELSQLVLDAKSGANASECVAEICADFATEARFTTSPDVILAVPPRPDGDGYDRFAPVRAAVAEAVGARDGDGLLTMEYTVDDYKTMNREARLTSNDGRFACRDVAGQNVLLIDDVWTSGSQMAASIAAAEEAGARQTTAVVLSVTQDALPESCPECGSNLVKRQRRSDGHAFIGCSGFHALGCRYTRNI
jgi:HAD superfamily hydrolase (TIGR01549 family)